MYIFERKASGAANVMASLMNSARSSAQARTVLRSPLLAEATALTIVSA